MGDNKTVSPLRDKATPPNPRASFLPSKLINSGPLSSQTLPLAPITSNENLATVSPGSHFPNKQTNRPATVPVLLPGASPQSCAFLLPVTSSTLQPIQPGLWRPRLDPITSHFLLRPSRPSPGLLPPFCAFVDSPLEPGWQEGPTSSSWSPADR